MRGIVRGLVALVAVWCAGAAPSLAQAPPPIEAFGRLPAVGDAAISPDGSKIALAMFQNGQAIINVVDLDRRSRVYAGALEDRSQLRSIGWVDDRYVSYVVSRTYHPGEVLPAHIRFRGQPRRVDYLRTGVLDLQAQSTRLLSTGESDSWEDQGSYVVAPIEGDAGHVRMIGRARGIEQNHPFVYRTNLQTGRSRSAGVRGINDETIGFWLDEQGRVAVRADSNRDSNRWRVFTYDGDAPRMLLEGVSDIGDPIRVEGLLPDNRIAAIDADEETGFDVLYAIDPANGAREVLFRREGADVSNGVNDPWTRRVIGASWSGAGAGTHFFEPEMDAVARRVSEIFAQDGEGWVASWARDRRRYLVFGERGLDGGAYYVYTAEDDRLQRVSPLYPDLVSAQLGVRQEITYPARDGTRIPAILTLPAAEEEPRDLPLVVLVHGGPHNVRDTLSFDWWAAFLTSRGYAVLQPNYRGSGGYGQAWEDAGKLQWGALMQTDVEDGVVALARARMIDPARTCIVGGSYGGYAALAGATLTPDRYRCAVSINGVSDLEEMLRQIAAQTGSDSMVSDWWRTSIGDRAEDRQRIRSVSPANLAENVRIPILLIHGTDDTVVPILQSRRMNDRLRDARKDVRFVELAGDDHWLSDESTRLQMLRELETFLAQHLAAD